MIFELLFFTPTDLFIDFYIFFSFEFKTLVSVWFFFVLLFSILMNYTLPLMYATRNPITTNDQTNKQTKNSFVWATVTFRWGEGSKRFAQLFSQFIWDLSKMICITNRWRWYSLLGIYWPSSNQSILQKTARIVFCLNISMNKTWEFKFK